MIVATLQLYNTEVKDGKPFNKDFDNTLQMYNWLMRQSHHPFLSYKLVEYKEVVAVKKTFEEA
jgi:hypothetical protein